MKTHAKAYMSCMSHTFYMCVALNLSPICTITKIMINYLYLICTIVYVVNNEDEGTGSSTSNVAIATAGGGISILMVIAAAIVIIILLYYCSRGRRSKCK